MLSLKRRLWIGGLPAFAAATFAVLSACTGGDDRAPLSPPTGLVAEGGDTVVDLSWSPVTGAKKYIVYWGDATVPVGARLPNKVTNVVATQWRHTGLINLQTYRYQVVAVGHDRKSPPSVEISSEPGPVPAPVEWAVVVTTGHTNTIHFSSSYRSDRYRVFMADSRKALEGRRPSSNYVEVTSGPAVDVSAVPGRGTYYRVIGVNGPRIGTGGYVATATEFTVRGVSVPFETPALWDVNGDGCLDMVGANGDCTGGFQTYSWADSGLSGIFYTPGRVNRDSRLADFNGDGKVDIISNVYSRADDTASRAMLLINDGSGRFTEDSGVAAMQIGGFGETIVTADFDNDGDLDIFLPHYWHRDDGGRNWLLINNGTGGFVDRAEAAGVARGPTIAPYIPEGAQAIDFDEDGWIDLLVASAIYINNRDGTFTNRAPEYKLPVRFDEGMKLTDVDLDGDLDLVQSDSFVTKLFRNNLGQFDSGTQIAGDESKSSFSFGLNMCDVNGDGMEDLVVAQADSTTKVGAPQLLVNVNGAFVPSDYGDATAGSVDLVACADLDRNGLSDVLVRWAGYRSMINVAASTAHLRIRVLGAAGQRNQQGRVVRIRPAVVPSRQLVRVVESGSGYMAQGDYDLLVGAPWDGEYEVSVGFSDRTVTGSMRQGQSVTVYQDGRFVAGLQ